MTFKILEAFKTILDVKNNNASRKECITLRKNAMNVGFVKRAFDTRYIDQETEFNPRRNLQNYNRSEAFISEATTVKLKKLNKLKNVCDELKIVYGKQPEWQDSNARVLLSTLEKGLRTEQMDGNYTLNQPSVGNLDYIEQLLYARYRLTHDNIEKFSSEELKNVILSKDEELIKRNVEPEVITKRDISTKSYDTLMEKLFDGVKASKENPNVERTITITIKDKWNE